MMALSAISRGCLGTCVDLNPIWPETNVCMENIEGFHIGDAAANFVCVKRHTKLAAASKLSAQSDF